MVGLLHFGNTTVGLSQENYSGRKTIKAIAQQKIDKFTFGVLGLREFRDAQTREGIQAWLRYKPVEKLTLGAFYEYYTYDRYDRSDNFEKNYGAHVDYQLNDAWAVSAMATFQNDEDGDVGSGKTFSVSLITEFGDDKVKANTSNSSAQNPLSFEGWLGLETIVIDDDGDREKAENVYGMFDASAKFDIGALTVGAGMIYLLDYGIDDDDEDDSVNFYTYAEYGSVRLSYGNIKDAQDHLLRGIDGPERFYTLAYDRWDDLDLEEYTARFDVGFTVANDIDVKLSVSADDLGDSGADMAYAAVASFGKMTVGLGYEDYHNRSRSKLHTLIAYKNDKWSIGGALEHESDRGDKQDTLNTWARYNVTDKLLVGGTLWFENDDGEKAIGRSLQIDYSFNESTSVSFATSYEDYSRFGDGKYTENGISLIKSF